MTSLSTLFIAVSGIIYSIITGIYSLTSTPVTSPSSVYQLAFHDFFVLFNTGLSIAAWVLFLSNAGMTTPWVAALFILSELVFVMKEIINLSLFHWYEMPTVHRDASSDIQRTQTRMVMEIEAHNHKSWVNLISALWLTGIIAVWCLMPEDWVVGALSLIALSIVHWRKQQDVSQIDAEMATRLQAMAEESTPWWVDDIAPRMESLVQSDLIAANELHSDKDSSRDWHNSEDRPVLGLASQSGIFSRKARDSRAASDTDRVDQSAITAIGYGWLTD